MITFLVVNICLGACNSLIAVSVSSQQKNTHLIHTPHSHTHDKFQVCLHLTYHWSKEHLGLRIQGKRLRFRPRKAAVPMLAPSWNVCTFFQTPTISFPLCLAIPDHLHTSCSVKHLTAVNNQHTD